MKNKLLQANSREELVKANKNRLPLAVPAPRNTQHTIVVKAFVRLLKLLALCPSGNANSLQTLYAIFQSLFEISIRTRKGLIVEDLLDLFSGAMAMDKGQHNRWIKIRAVYLTALQEGKLKLQVSQDLALMCGMMSPEGELKNFVTSKHFTGTIRQAMMSFTCQLPFQGNLAALQAPAVQFLKENSLLKLKEDTKVDLAKHPNANHQEELDEATRRILEREFRDIFSDESQPVSIVDVVYDRLLTKDLPDLWRMLPKLNPSYEQVAELASAYKNYQLTPYLLNNLVLGCDLDAIIGHVEEMLEIFRDRLGHIDCQFLEQTLRDLRSIQIVRVDQHNG